MKYLDSLKGYKTYLVAAIAIVLAGLESLGYITPEVYDILLKILAGFGLASLRHAIK